MEILNLRRSKKKESPGKHYVKYLVLAIQIVKRKENIWFYRPLLSLLSHILTASNVNDTFHWCTEKGPRTCSTSCIKHQNHL